MLSIAAGLVLPERRSDYHRVSPVCCGAERNLDWDRRKTHHCCVSERTYEIQPAPPAPEVEDYVNVSSEEWQQLLVSCPKEEAVQSFLERNPMFLPGAWTPGIRSGHYPLHCAAISQPLLPGLRAKKPDFMWVSAHSLTWYPTLIEIERPSKRVFRSKGIPSAEFTQARNQLAEWRTWFSKPENVQQFIASYGIPESFRLGRRMELHMILVYGRRDEVQQSPELSELRASLMTAEDEELMSFDRLSPDTSLADSITVRATGCGGYEAIHVPPLFRLGPRLADRLLAIKGIQSALTATPLISHTRREFLISRVGYWEDWARNGKHGTIHSRDEE